LVDDTQNYAEMMDVTLTRLGFAVTTHTVSQSALALFREQSAVWDLVVTDQIMPDLSGIDLIGAVKAIRPTLPCILMTGYADNLSIPEALEFGADFVLHKPFEPQELRDALQRLLSPDERGSEKDEVVAT
jgi:DNA-binding NtrC family response regulator